MPSTVNEKQQKELKELSQRLKNAVSANEKARLLEQLSKKLQEAEAQTN